MTVAGRGVLNREMLSIGTIPGSAPNEDDKTMTVRLETEDASEVLAIRVIGLGKRNTLSEAQVR